MPLLTLTVVDEFVIRLRTASLGPVVTVPALSRSITAVSAVPGTLCCTQSLAVSQAAALGGSRGVPHDRGQYDPVPSRPSIEGLRLRDRLRSARLRLREKARSVTLASW